MKFALGIIALICCVVVSYMLSAKFIHRKKFYQDFNLFNKRLKSEVAFSQTSILAIANEYKMENTLLFNNLCDYFEGEEIELKEKYIKKE